MRNSSEALRKGPASIPRGVLWTILIAVLLRVIFFLFADDNGGDGLARLAMTDIWLRHPSWSPVFAAYLPLHFWLIAGLTLLVRNVALAGRLVSLILGVASVGLFWRLAERIYGLTAAWLSLAVFCFYSLHISVSSVSGAEATYIFFLLAGLVGFFDYLHTARLPSLALSGISMTMAAAVRYESWVLIFAMSLVLLAATWKSIRQNGWQWVRVRPLLLFCSMAGAWPLFWMWYVWRKLGDPLYFIHGQHKWVAEIGVLTFRSPIYLLSFTPGVLFLTLSPIAFLGSLYALALAAREQPGRELAFLAVFFGTIQFYQLVSGAAWTSARFTITLGVFLALMSGYGLQEFMRRHAFAWRRCLTAFVVATLVVNVGAILWMSHEKGPLSEKFRSISPLAQFARPVEEVGAVLRPRLGPSDGIVIDNVNCESNMVAAAAGLPLNSSDRVFLTASEIPTGKCESDLNGELLKAGLPVLSQAAPDTPNNFARLDSFITNRRPRFLVYSPVGVLPSYVALSGPCINPIVQRNLQFQCVFEGERYRVYELHYQ